MLKVSKITFAFACLALVASKASAATVTFTPSNQGGFQVLDFFYSSDAGEEFAGWELDVTCLTGGNCISDPNRGATSATTQWDNIAGGPRLDTWTNTVYSHLYDSPPSYIFNSYKPSAPGQSPIPTNRLWWTTFDTDTGDTNDIEPTTPAPYHLGRVLTATGSTGTITVQASDSVGVPSQFAFAFGAVVPPAPILQDYVHGEPTGPPSEYVAAGDELALNLVTLMQTGGDPATTWALSNFQYTAAYEGVNTNNDQLGASVTNSGNFTWNTDNANRGIYRWDVTATNAGGADTEQLEIHVQFVPEPATLALVGLALVGFVGIGRRR